MNGTVHMFAAVSGGHIAETIIAMSDLAEWVFAFACIHLWSVPAQLNVRLHSCVAYAIKLFFSVEIPYFGTYTDILRSRERTYAEYSFDLDG